MTTWWAVKVVPSGELRVARAIRLALREGGRADVLVRVPLQRFAEVGRKAARWKKLRPGFVFLGTEGDELDAQVRELVNVRGVGCVDGRAGEPCPLPREVAAPLEAGWIGAPGWQRNRRPGRRS